MDCLHATSTYSESLMPSRRPSADMRAGTTSCLPSSTHCTRFESDCLQQTLMTPRNTQRRPETLITHKETLRDNQRQPETHLMTLEGVQNRYTQRCTDTHRQNRIPVKVTSFLSKVKKIFSLARPLPCSPSNPFLLNCEVER